MTVKLLFLGLSFLLWGGFSLGWGSDWRFLLLFRRFDTEEFALLVSSLEATVTHLG